VTDLGASPDESLLLEEKRAAVLVLTEHARVTGPSRRKVVALGDKVTVLGFLDRVFDPGCALPLSRRPPLRPVVRSGDALPLLVVVAERD
jgi:hypothetical protein